MNPLTKIYTTNKEKFEKLQLITKAGSWLECSDYEGTVSEVKSHNKQLVLEILEAQIEEFEQFEVSCVDDRLLGKSDDYLDGWNTSTEWWRIERDNFLTFLHSAKEEILTDK